jgi:hypothetical protein
MRHALLHADIISVVSVSTLGPQHGDGLILVGMVRLMKSSDRHSAYSTGCFPFQRDIFAHVMSPWMMPA